VSEAPLLLDVLLADADPAAAVLAENPFSCLLDRLGVVVL
jgi:hypothetical protein